MFRLIFISAFIAMSSEYDRFFPSSLYYFFLYYFNSCLTAQAETIYMVVNKSRNVNLCLVLKFNTFSYHN
jgi:hypothetical protein